MPEEDIIEQTQEEIKRKPTTKSATSKLKPRIDFDEPAKSFEYTGNFKSDIAGNKKLFNKGDSVEKMERSTIEFIVNTSRRAVATIEKEEENYIKELVARRYYPESVTHPVTEEEMVKNLLNLV